MVISVVVSQINDSIQDEMYTGLIDRYNGSDATDGDSTSWNTMQTQVSDLLGREKYFIIMGDVFNVNVQFSVEMLWC